ncbi:peptidase inhibitor family I36 protein [Micromonospora sp. CPCC 206061]|uniref:peptidase inhibitor family I36 protein n=1 Tax=Micromonospora sp. CPCC 206061 TaxID=3122410 RepID=UPI002FF2B66D
MHTANRRRQLLAMAGATVGLASVLAPSATPAYAGTQSQVDSGKSQAGLTSADAPDAVAGAAASGWLGVAAAAPDSDDVTVAAPLRNGVCDPGEICVYKNSNREGPIIDWARGDADYHYGNDSWPIVGGEVINEASSVWNRTDCEVRLYADDNHNGNSTPVGANRWRNLGGTPVGNDNAESHKSFCP